MARRKKESDTSIGEDALLHGKALLVVTTGNAENVSLPFVSNGIAFNLLAHAFVIKDAEFVFIVNVDEFLAASGRIRDVELGGG